MINKIQNLNFKLMEATTFNGFDGERVVKSLKDHRELWRGAVMDRAGYKDPDSPDYSEAISLIKLRDIKDNYWNVDTLYILPTAGKEKELETLASGWGADEVNYIGGKRAGSILGSAIMTHEKQILRVWWD